MRNPGIQEEAQAETAGNEALFALLDFSRLPNSKDQYLSETVRSHF